MGNTGVFTKIPAVFGAVLVLLPVVALLVFSVIGFIGGRPYQFDYLIPAELFPVAFVGGGLLVWTSARVHMYRKLIGWSFWGAVISLFAGQVLAVVTGLASGANEPRGLPWALVVATIGIYTLLLPVVGVGGVLLVRHVFRRPYSKVRP